MGPTARWGQRLQAGGEVRGVADGGVVHLQVVSDRAHHRHPGVDADAGAQRPAQAVAAPRGELRESIANRQRRAQGALGGVLVGDRSSKQRHHAIARELIDDALEAIDLTQRQLQILVEELAVELRIEALGDSRRIHQIAEENRHALALARGSR